MSIVILVQIMLNTPSLEYFIGHHALHPHLMDSYDRKHLVLLRMYKW